MTRAERLGLEPESIRPAIQELESRNVNDGPFESEVAHSIAISLKRIADALDGTALGVDVSRSLAALNLNPLYQVNQP